MSKKYRVKVTEIHSDFVWIDAETEDEAREKAPSVAACEFERLLKCEIVSDDEGN